jgi:hypothetical protein
MTAFLFGLVLVVHGSAVRNDWGLNPNPVSCPRCDTQLSQIKIPKSLRQALWGGYTCPNCGCEVDKWGRETAPPTKAFSMAAHASVSGPAPVSSARILRRSFLIFAPLLYVVEVALEPAPRLQDRLLRPIVGVILSTLLFAAALIGLARLARRAQDKKDPPPAADRGSQSNY